MIHDIVVDSRSCRSFDESKPIGKEDLLDLIETARICPSAGNLQPLKYRLVYEKDEVEELLGLTKWAALLPDLVLPPEGHHPTAFIIVCCDTTICSDPDSVRFDAGIVSQTMMLEATEIGFGGCILGAFSPSEVSSHMLIPKKYKPVILLAFGVPEETIIICNPDENGNTAYFRGKANVHFVPKRLRDDIIIE